MPIPKPSSKLLNLPPYVFVHVENVKAQARKKGLDLIDLAMGNPDLPTPEHIVDEMCRSVRKDLWTHRYPPAKGTIELRTAIANWYKKRFSVNLDPETEVAVLIGSKEGIANLYRAYTEPGDYILATNPAYPVHYFTVGLCGANLHMMPLNEENNFMPQLDKIPADIADKAKILLLNYPNNPTGAILEDGSLFDKAIEFAKNRDMMVLHDFAYSEITFDNYQPPSFLQHRDAKKYGVEFNSLSKSYNMAGWRLGFVAGNADIIAGLVKYKSFGDYSAPQFIQMAAAHALNSSQKCVKDLASEYRNRRDAIVKNFRSAGWEVPCPKASMYVWARLPKQFSNLKSLEFVDKLILEEGVALSPGTGFGPNGEGFVRIAMVAPCARIEEAAKRIKRFIERCGS